MKYVRPFCFLLVALVGSLHALSQSVSGSTIQDGFGRGALLSSGQACFSVSPFTSQTCFPISNGSFSGSMAVSTYRFQVLNPSGNAILTLNTVTLTPTWNFDTYQVPIATPQSPTASGNGPPYLPGAYNSLTLVGSQYLQLDPAPGYSALWTMGSPAQGGAWFQSPINPSNQTENGSRPATINDLLSIGNVTCAGGPCLPLTGGSLSGALAGTSAVFVGAVTAAQLAATQVNNSLYASRYASLAVANAAVTGCPSCTMIVDSGSTLALTANTVLGGKWDFSGCGIVTRGTFTVGYTQVPTFAGSDCQIFDAAGTGVVTFPSGTGRVKGSWFGAVPSNADATNAINQAGASAAASHLPIDFAGNLTAPGQITFNGVNTIRGDGPQGTSITTITTSYTAGCAVQIQNAFDAYVAGISLVYSVPTAGISTASGICTESFRRGNIEHVLVTGANTCFDTSNAGGQANPIGTFQLHIDDFKCYNFTGHGMLLTKAVGTGSSAGDGSMLLTNVRFDNNSAPGGTVPKDFIELGTSSDVHFDTINFQNTVLDGTSAAVPIASDSHNTQFTNLHIEANTFACTVSGSVSCGFFGARGTTTVMVDGITYQNNVMNIANIVGGKWAMFQAQTGGNLFRVRHFFSLQNTLTGMVSTPMFNYFESGAAGTGDATLDSSDFLDSAFTVAADGNFAASNFKDYLKPSQFPYWFYGVDFVAGDTDQSVDCNRPDRSQTLDYETTFTANHTLTLVTGTGYNNCQVRVFMNSASTRGTAFTLTIQDDAAHTIGVFTGSHSLQLNFTAHAIQWQLADEGVLNDDFLSTVLLEGGATIRPQVSATAGVPVNSPSLNIQANYPVAGVSFSDFFTFRDVPQGTGDNPPMVGTWTNSGSTGGHSWNLNALNPVAAAMFNSNGATQTAANITASTGWGTSGAAGNGISAVSGSQRFRFTVTAAGTPSANPTFTATFPVTYLTTPICTAQMVAGTGTISPIASGTETTTSTGTMTFKATPVAASTYTIVVDCRL